LRAGSRTLERGTLLREQVTDIKRCERHQQDFTYTESFIKPFSQLCNDQRTVPGRQLQERASEGCTQHHTRRVSDRKHCSTRPSCGSGHCSTARPCRARAHREETIFPVPPARTRQRHGPQASVRARARARSILDLVPLLRVLTLLTPGGSHSRCASGRRRTS
jgi:hypothetical protein